MNVIKQGYITAAQGLRGSQGRERIPMTKTATQGSRGPQRRGRMMSAAAARRSKCGARVISKDSEDHGIGHRLDCGVRSHEFMTKRLDLSLDCSLVQKKGALSHDEVLSV